MERKWVLITGSGKGLGKELALIFSKNNYNIILHGRNLENLEKVMEAITKNNAECRIIVGDLKNYETIEKLSKIAIEKNIFILINNAAIGTIKNFADLSEEEIVDELAVNLIAPMRLTKKIYDLMLRKKDGIIININGIDGLKIAKDGRTAYSTSKFGLRGFTDALRFESKKHNIKVIGFYLGGIKTDMYSKNQNDASNCMETSEVSEIIFNACKDYKSLQVEDIFLGRMKY